MAANEIAVALGLGLAGGGFVFYVLYPFVLTAKGAFVAGVLAAAAFTTGLLWPGKRATSAEALLREMAPPPESPRAVAADWKEKYQAALSGRFTRELPFARSGGQKAGFAEVTAEGRTAWLDLETKLVWSEALDFPPGAYDQKDWKRAVEACRRKAPDGAWALPSMAELMAIRKRGAEGIPDWKKEGRWYASVYVDGFPEPLMGGFGTGTSSNNAGNGSAPFGARCVARSPGAPMEGYPVQSTEDALRALGGD